MSESLDGEVHIEDMDRCVAPSSVVLVCTRLLVAQFSCRHMYTGECTDELLVKKSEIKDAKDDNAKESKDSKDTKEEKNGKEEKNEHSVAAGETAKQDATSLLVSLIAGAHRFQLQEMVSWCSSKLAGLVTADNAADLLAVAETYGLADVKVC